MSRYAEARFLRGETGVDGAATEEQQDAAEVEKDKARDQFVQGKSWLGREFLTWLLFRSESSEPVIDFDGVPLSVIFSDRLVLRGIDDDVLEMSVRGTLSPYSPLVKAALSRGLLVHAARLNLSHGEREFQVNLDAEHLTIKSAKLPELLTEEEDDRLQERLELTEHLAEMIRLLVEEYLRLRSSPQWLESWVPQMREWMELAEAQS